MFVEIFLSLFVGTPDILSVKTDPPVQTYSAKSTDTLLAEAKHKTLNLEYEQAIQILKQFQPSRSQYNEYYFLSAVSYFALNDKQNAIKASKNLRDTFEKLERRHEAILSQIEETLQHWKEGDLSDIERDMIISRDRLSTTKAGTDTQKIQKQIVDKLDKLIKDEEDKIKKAMENASSSPIPMPIENPAPDSIIMGGVQGKGKIDEKQLRQIGETWGTLPPAKRAKIVEDITRDVPSKYRVQIEEYFKALNKIYK
jgi:tetratricopeptide (TPR) repeat protein